MACDVSPVAMFFFYRKLVEKWANIQIHSALALLHCTAARRSWRKLYSLCCMRPPDGKRDGWNIWGDETLTIHVSIPKPLLDNPPLLHNFQMPNAVDCVASAAADDFAGVSRLPLSSSCLRSPAPIGLCTLPASKLRTPPIQFWTGPHFTSVVASSWPTASAGQAGPVQDFSNVPTQGLKAPEAHTPLL